jgi:hypothetical protein
MTNHEQVFEATRLIVYVVALFDQMDHLEFEFLFLVLCVLYLLEVAQLSLKFQFIDLRSVNQSVKILYLFDDVVGEIGNILESLQSLFQKYDLSLQVSFNPGRNCQLLLYHLLLCEAAFFLFDVHERMQVAVRVRVRLFWYCIFNLLPRHNLADELGRVIVHLFEKFAQFKLLTSQIDFITQVLGLDKLALLYKPLELILDGWCQGRFGADLFLDFRLLLGSQVFILPLLVAQRR